MRPVLLGTNLLAGGAAAVGLVVLVFAFGVPFWLAVPLALAAFAGLALLRPGAGAGAGAAPAVDRAALAATLRQGATDVAELRRLAGRVPTAPVKARVLAICDSADRILAALAEDGRDPQAARAFLDRYLAPAKGLLTQYVRLSTRGVAAAGPALAKIEEADLPLLDRKLRELYEGLHRGDVIDLEVASEMLEFDLAGVGTPTVSPPPRRLDG